MKNIISLIFIPLIAVCIYGGCKDKSGNHGADKKLVENLKQPSVEKLWSTLDELKVPESVMYDSKNNVLYVSNINGNPTEKNSRGFISKVSLDGVIKKLVWVTGMNAPKGMGIIDNKLYVTDIDRVHIIDISKAEIIKSYKISGAKFLNDIAIDRSGKIFITDMVTGKIHLIENEKSNVWLKLKDYKKPNGLYIDDNILYIGTSSGLLKSNINTKKIELFIANIGGIDGLKPTGNKSFIVSNWKGKVQIISKDKKPVLLSDTSKDKINAADLEFIKEKELILVPTFFNNRVVAYKLNYK